MSKFCNPQTVIDSVHSPPPPKPANPLHPCLPPHSPTTTPKRSRCAPPRRLLSVRLQQDRRDVSDHRGKTTRRQGVRSYQLITEVGFSVMTLEARIYRYKTVAIKRVVCIFVHPKTKNKGNVGETSRERGWSAYGLFRAHRYHLQLN